MGMIDDKRLYPGGFDTEQQAASHHALTDHQTVMRGPYAVCISCPYEHTVDTKVVQALGMMVNSKHKS